MTLDELAKLIAPLKPEQMAAILERSEALIGVENARAAYERAQADETARSLAAQKTLADLEQAWQAADRAAKGL